MSILDLSRRVLRSAQYLPVVNDVLTVDYERDFQRGPTGLFRGVYRDFAAAEASIPAGKRVGYDHVELAGMYRKRMTKACESDYAVLYWMRRILEGEPSSIVYDFGGHVGVSYHGWQRYLPYGDSMRWIVYDMPAITKVGEELARESKSRHLSFSNAVEDARDCTVFFSAGALQYCDESVASVLDRAGARPRHIILNKMPVYEGESFVTVQSTGRAFHAYRIFNRDELVGSIESRGYRLVDDWQNREQSCSIPFTRGKEIEAYSGYYFERV